MSRAADRSRDARSRFALLRIGRVSRIASVVRTKRRLTAAAHQLVVCVCLAPQSILGLFLFFLDLPIAVRQHSHGTDEAADSQ